MNRANSELVVVGAITGAHGVRGEVRVRSFTEDPSSLFGFGPLRNSNGETVLTPVSHRAGKKGFIVQPAERQEKEYWDSLRGTELHVDRQALPPPDEGEFYIEDLVGLKAAGADGRPLGTVSAVFNHGAGDLIEIMPADGSANVLIPFTEDDVPDIDFEAGSLTIADFGLWIQTAD